MQSTAEETTRLLHEAREGHQVSAERLMNVVYGDLRALAQRQVARERENHTLQPTALVHEVYVRVFGGSIWAG